MGTYKTSICVSCMKGGTGKTTLVLNMAEYFAQKSKRVLVIDIDPQAQSCLYFAPEESLLDRGKVTLYVLLEFITRNAAKIEGSDGSTIKELKTKFLYSLFHRGNMSVIASTPQLTEIEPMIHAKTATIYLLRSLFRIAYEFCDIILIDCPPNINSELVKSAYVASRNVVIPTDATKFGYYGLMKTYEWYLDTKTIFNPAINLAGIVITKYQEQKVLHKAVYEELMADSNLRDNVLRPPLPLLTDFERSMHINQYVGKVNPTGKAARLFIELMENLEQTLAYEGEEDNFEQKVSR